MPLEPDELVAFATQYDPPGRRRGVCWLVELRDASGMCTLPMASAYLTDCRPVMGVVLDFILVPDQHRRQSYATRLIRELVARWPDLELTDAISPAGEAFAAHLEVVGLVDASES